MSKIKSLTSYAVDAYRLYFITTTSAGILIALIVGGCGYGLSGANSNEQLFAPVLKNISIEGLPRYDAFRVRLKKDALSYRMKVVAAEFATTKIIVKNKEIKQQTITIGDDAKVREYLVTAHIDFFVVIANNESPRQYPLQSIQSETTYTYYPQHVSISLNEKERALALLNEDLSSKLINRLRILTNKT